LTPIRAVAQLAERRDDVRLYFLGVEHPNPAVPRMEMAGRAVRLAEELGVRDRFVFFNFGWVPYAERAGYLLEADAGISAHVETVEARYAFRTRVLDYLWARLPILATHGDALADLVEREALGATLAPGDVDGWTAAIERVLDAGGEESARRRVRIGEVREQFTWPRVVEPLARLAEAEPGPAPSGVRSAALLADRARRRARITLARRGVLGSLRRAGEKAAWRARLLARGRR
jgi:glycosyltransferase involved in cell wall biosynthesis